MNQGRYGAEPGPMPAQPVQHRPPGPPGPAYGPGGPAPAGPPGPQRGIQLIAHSYYLLVYNHYYIVTTY